MLSPSPYSLTVGHIHLTSPSQPPSLFNPLGSSTVADAGHMPRCHSPFLVSNLPLSSVTAINQALTARRHGDGGPLGWGRSSDPPGLYECCRLIVLALTSPTSRQRRGSKDQYCPYTHLPDPQTPANAHKRNQHPSKRWLQHVGDSQTENLPAPPQWQQRQGRHFSAPSFAWWFTWYENGCHLLTFYNNILFSNLKLMLLNWTLISWQ